MTPPPGRAAAQPDGPTHPTPELEPLPAFLERRQLEVLDVVPAAVPAGRRLLVGRSEKQRHILSIAVADTGAASVVLDHEEAVLGRLRSPSGRRTWPAPCRAWCSASRPAPPRSGWW